MHVFGGAMHGRGREGGKEQEAGGKGGFLCQPSKEAPPQEGVQRVAQKRFESQAGRSVTLQLAA
jgi:hypothetical protein